MKEIDQVEPNRRRVKVAKKVISMMRPTTASQAAMTTSLSSRNPYHLIYPNLRAVLSRTK